MSMMISTSNSNTRTITFKNADGTVAGTLSIRSAAKKKTKRLQYNFKEISTQIMMTKTSGSARQIVAKARRKVATLQRSRKTDQYDEQELQSAIVHAKKLERIARKRMKHLQQEEELQKSSSPFPAEADKESEHFILDQMNGEDIRKRSKEELQELIEELSQKIEAEKSDHEWNDVLSEIASDDLEPADLDRLKKKHRSEELREIMEADMKYLKSMFAKLAREKQNVSNAISNGVSLQLGGLDLPVQAAEAPVMTEGGTIDASV